MKNKEKKYKLMAYGIEKVGINKPSLGIISKGNFELSFEDFHTNKRFNEFDGIILFQGIFEQYKFKKTMYGKYLEPSFEIENLLDLDNLINSKE
jgi:hypothetical protein